MMLAKGTGVDLLCYVPITEIETRGITYLIAKLVPNNPDQLWDQKISAFREYFTYTWMRSYNPELWNIHRSKEKWENIQNRTNNPLERFNRVMNYTFPTGNPSVPKFIDGIKELSNQTVKLDDIKNKRVDPVQREEMFFYYPPRSYDIFDPSNIQ